MWVAFVCRHAFKLRLDGNYVNANLDSSAG